MSERAFDPVSSRYTRDATVQRGASEILLSLAPPGASDDVLDVGCGTGALAARIRTMTRGRVAGADPSPGMLEAARREAAAGVEFVLAAAEDLRFSAEFDLVLSSSALQWFRDIPRALARMRAALRPEGRLAVQAPARREYCPELVAAIDEVARDARTAATFATFRPPWVFLETAGEYSEMLERACFSVSLARIDEVVAHETADGALRVFNSGAAAGYLGSDNYPAPLPAGYADAMREIVGTSLARRAGPDGMVDLRFRRVFLLARAA
jgi:ubiquinone/menaquinone biosynthesis C-methylase UbiE